MQLYLSIICTLGLFLQLTTASFAAENLNVKFEAFRQEVKKHIASGNKDGLNSLRYHKGAITTKEAEHSDNELTKAVIESTIDSIEIEPVDDNFESSAIAQCKSFQLNLKPVAVLIIKGNFAEGGEYETEWPVGIKDNTPYFPASLITPLDPNAPNVFWFKVFGDQPIEFNGEVSYTRGGKPHKEKFNGTTDFDNYYCVEEFEHIEIKSNSQNGKYRLYAMQEGDPIFDSGLHNANGKLSYKRDSNQIIKADENRPRR